MEGEGEGEKKSKKLEEFRCKICKQKFTSRRKFKAHEKQCLKKKAKRKRIAHQFKAAIFSKKA